MRRGHGETLLRILGWLQVTANPSPEKQGSCLVGTAFPQTRPCHGQNGSLPQSYGQEASKAGDVTETESGMWTLGLGWEFFKGDGFGPARGQRPGEGCPPASTRVTRLLCVPATGSDGKRALRFLPR